MFSTYFTTIQHQKNRLTKVVIKSPIPRHPIKRGEEAALDFLGSATTPLLVVSASPVTPETEIALLTARNSGTVTQNRPSRGAFRVGYYDCRTAPMWQ